MLRRMTVLDKILTRGLLPSLLWLGTGQTMQAQSASAAPLPHPAFEVDTLSITAPELAEELGYKFHGYTWHFSAPTYVRLQLYADESEGDGPQNPPPSTTPDRTLDLDGTQREVSVRIIEHQTDEPVRDGGSTSINLKFQIKLSGEAAQPGVDEASPGLEAVAAAALPKPLAAKMYGGQGIGMTYQFSLEQGHRHTFSSMHREGSGTFGQMFGQLADLANLAAKPDADAVAGAALKAKWQTAAEAALLEKPLEVYFYRADVEPKKGADSVFAQCRVFRVVLECSRQPFTKEEAGDKAKGSPSPEPAPTPVASP